MLRSDKIPHELFNDILEKKITKLHLTLMQRTLYLDEEIPALTLKLSKPNLSKVFTELINRPFDFNKPWYPIN
jgi:hypothetical protein